MEDKMGKAVLFCIGFIVPAGIVLLMDISNLLWGIATGVVVGLLIAVVYLMWSYHQNVSSIEARVRKLRKPPSQ